MTWPMLMFLTVARMSPAQTPDTSQIAVIVADSTLLQPANSFPFGGHTVRVRRNFERDFATYTKGLGAVDTRLYGPGEGP